MVYTSNANGRHQSGLSVYSLVSWSKVTCVCTKCLFINNISHSSLLVHEACSYVKDVVFAVFCSKNRLMPDFRNSPEAVSYINDF